jgi:tetratricopeptide (TPR) repeat protein
MSKYNTDLDYVILDIDISWDELKEIEAEADKIISKNKESKENLALAYLKKVQILKKGASGHTCGFIFYDEVCWPFLLPKEKKDIKKHLEKAMKLIPNMPEVLMQLGLLNNSGWGDKNDKAIKFINKAIQLKPDYAAAFNNRAMLFYHSGSFDNEDHKEKTKINFRNAVADLTEAIKIRPFDALYHLNRATFHSRLEEHKEAVEDFSNAINYASDALKEKLISEVKIFNLRGKEYTELKDYGKAIDDFSESLRFIQENNDKFLVSVEKCMEQIDRDRVYSDLYKTLLMRAKAYYLSDEKDKAKADIEEYINHKREAADENNRNEIIRITGIKPEDIL